LPAGSQNPLLSAMNNAFYTIESQADEVKHAYTELKSSHFKQFYLDALEG
jgi:TPP-dependent 2-oxoacid decarboxylase